VSEAILLEGVGKRYRLSNDGGLLVKRVLTLGLGRRRHTDLWALRDLSFSCEEGATLGVIGRNGSGKTTLLKLLAGVSAPTVGHVRVKGSIAPLIGVGVGFNPELTGRENVFANGQLLGMGKARIRREFDEIVAFSELEDFLDVPVKFYSSGMFLRLAFAVAIQVRPEVMLVDEVLAVGDFAFQIKCMERMAERQAEGATIVVVTHSMMTLHRMCQRTIVLSGGTVVFDGPTDKAISVYHDLMQIEGAKLNAAGLPQQESGFALPFAGGAQVACEVIDGNGLPTRQVAAGAPLRARVRAEFDGPVRDPVVGIAVSLDGLGPVYMAALQPGDYRGDHGPGAPLEFTVALETPLLAGTFMVVGAVLDAGGRHELGRSTSELFAVTSGEDARGLVDMGARFRIGGEEHAPRQAGLAR
jgi:ABC-type polysaccharide/polyol phosphate transport system ATPase subunit